MLPETAFGEAEWMVDHEDEGRASVGPSGDVAVITPSAIELGGALAEGFAPVAVARETLRRARTAALATLDPVSGYPLATLVNVATDSDGSPILLASRLSLHTRNMLADGRASLLIASFGRGDPMAASARVSIVGRVEATTEPRVRRRFLARHPKAALYADFGDFAFYRIVVEGIHLNAGFARAAELGPDDLLLDLTGAEALLEAEEGAVAHMNEDHGEALELYATRLLSQEGGPWSATGLDPEGMDLASGERTARLVFPEPVRDAGALRRTLVALAARARDMDV